jgi:hypothetical protein
VRQITNPGYYEKKKNSSSAQISDYWLGHVFLAGSTIPGFSA